ncbi:uncharacterized protein BXZ73DRAFT_91190 [Epithele typhae]|uniref:uncharacterized protein n=1 Tax=Epithele typhae TaxID=378194 RepID=UPI0020089EDB|nr:uncharacterized protein BXZ73DRAFT_91190 [Epithele typhae]KAH9925047.1 hypothetical protein BXZ73DRAFT_91190 [Epithele typhae]
MPLTRPETLQALHFIGVELPATTRIPDVGLNRRLRDALNAAQDKDTLPATLDINALKKWAPPSSARQSAPSTPRAAARRGEGEPPQGPLLDAFSRGNAGEAFQNMSGSNGPDLYTDVFADLRQTTMALANIIDAGRSTAHVGSSAEDCGVNVRIVSVVEVNEHTPAIVVLYRDFTIATAAEGLAWVQEHFRGPAPLTKVHATPLEIKLFLKLLDTNAALLPEGHDVAKLRGPHEDAYRLSVVLPVAPLDFTAVAKLNYNPGCHVCGKRDSKYCPCRCLRYCGRECQTADRAAHKQTCKSLDKGVWKAVKVRACPPGNEHMRAFALNRYDRLDPAAQRRILAEVESGPRAGDAPPPPSLYGDAGFIAKLQVALGPAPTEIMVYDKRRSMQVYVVAEDDAELFGLLVDEMKKPGSGYGGVKMYRWARRTGDWELEICIDRQPIGQVMW